MPGQLINASVIAASFKNETKSIIAKKRVSPKLVAFLANDDPAARTYADWTSKSFAEAGLTYVLKQVDKTELEKALVEANQDLEIHGIMIYYPVFGDRQDQYLQSCVSEQKDVEGLCHKYIYNMYHNIRFLDEPINQKKCIIPCTPLAVVKVLEYVGVYNKILEYGNRLHGKTITVVNRSEVVGRPLAALLANDGAKVYSVDINNVQEFSRGDGLVLSRHQVADTNLKLDDVIPISDVVITGVPSPNFKVQTSLLKEGCVAVNFSSAKNFMADVRDRASIFVPSIGKITIAMLERNLLRLHDYYAT